MHSQMWLHHLNNFPAELFHKTMEKLPDLFPGPHAPTLGEFKGACKEFKVRPEHTLIPSALRLDDKSAFDPIGKMNAAGKAAREELLQLVKAKTITP